MLINANLQLRPVSSQATAYRRCHLVALLPVCVTESSTRVEGASGQCPWSPLRWVTPGAVVVLFCGLQGLGSA